MTVLYQSLSAPSFTILWSARALNPHCELLLHPFCLIVIHTCDRCDRWDVHPRVIRSQGFFLVLFINLQELKI